VGARQGRCLGTAPREDPEGDENQELEMDEEDDQHRRQHLGRSIVVWWGGGQASKQIQTACNLQKSKK
jgi:hypothetical protein